MIVSILKNLNECDHQPAADFTPQLAGAYFHKNLHVLQHRKPGQQPLLGDGLNRTAGIRLSSSFMNINWSLTMDEIHLRSLRRILSLSRTRRLEAEYTEKQFER